MANDKQNLYQKLAKVRKNLEVIQKDSEGYGYNYVSEAEILSKLSVWLDKMGLLLIPEIEPGTCITHLQPIETEKYDKKTGQIIKERKVEAVSEGEMTFTWVNVDDGEKLSIPWMFVGQQADASQAFGSGLTYCTRYFLLKFFNIATTEDDPDNWRSKQKKAEKEEDILIAKELVAKIDEAAKNYVANSKDAEAAKAELLKVSKKYVKSGNYNKIEEPALAAKLLEEVKKLSESPTETDKPTVEKEEK